MTKPKKHDYRIQYIDNTYQVVEWSKPEFQAVGEAMEKGSTCHLIRRRYFQN
jgi:hypothetical protein